MNQYGIVNKKTNEVVHTFNASNDKTSTGQAMAYLLGRGLSVTEVKSTFKVVGFITNHMKKEGV